MRAKAQPKTSEQGKIKFRDMHSIVCDVLVHMECPSSITSFKLDEAEIFDNLVQQIKRDCPNMVSRLGV